MKSTQKIFLLTSIILLLSSIQACIELKKVVRQPFLKTTISPQAPIILSPIIRYDTLYKERKALTAKQIQQYLEPSFKTNYDLFFTPQINLLRADIHDIRDALNQQTENYNKLLPILTNAIQQRDSTARRARAYSAGEKSYQQKYFQSQEDRSKENAKYLEQQQRNSEVNSGTNQNLRMLTDLLLTAMAILVIYGGVNVFLKIHHSKTVNLSNPK